MPIDAAALIEATGRVLIGSLYLYQGFNAATQRFAFHTERLRARRIPASGVVLTVGFLMMFAGGAMVMLNVYSRIGAIFLLVFTVTATVLFQNFWSIKDPERRREKRTSFMYNLAIIGGILMVVAHGNGSVG